MRKRDPSRSRRNVPSMINPIMLLVLITIMLIMLLWLPVFFERIEKQIDDTNNNIKIHPDNIEYIELILYDKPEDGYKDFLNLLLEDHDGIIRSEISKKEKTAKIIYDNQLTNRCDIIIIFKKATFYVKEVD